MAKSRVRPFVKLLIIFCFGGVIGVFALFCLTIEEDVDSVTQHDELHLLQSNDHEFTSSLQPQFSDKLYRNTDPQQLLHHQVTQRYQNLPHEAPLSVYERRGENYHHPTGGDFHAENGAPLSQWHHAQFRGSHSPELHLKKKGLLALYLDSDIQPPFDCLDEFEAERFTNHILSDLRETYEISLERRNELSDYLLSENSKLLGTDAGSCNKGKGVPCDDWLPNTVGDFCFSERIVYEKQTTEMTSCKGIDKSKFVKQLLDPLSVIVTANYVNGSLCPIYTANCTYDPSTQVNVTLIGCSRESELTETVCEGCIAGRACNDGSKYTFGDFCFAGDGNAAYCEGMDERDLQEFDLDLYSIEFHSSKPAGPIYTATCLHDNTIQIQVQRPTPQTLSQPFLIPAGVSNGPTTRNCKVATLLHNIGAKWSTTSTASPTELPIVCKSKYPRFYNRSDKTSPLEIIPSGLEVKVTAAIDTPLPETIPPNSICERRLDSFFHTIYFLDKPGMQPNQTTAQIVGCDIQRPTIDGVECPMDYEVGYFEHSCRVLKANCVRCCSGQHNSVTKNLCVRERSADFPSLFVHKHYCTCRRIGAPKWEARSSKLDYEA